MKIIKLLVFLSFIHLVACSSYAVNFTDTTDGSFSIQDSGVQKMIVFLDWGINDSVSVVDSDGTIIGYIYCQNRNDGDITLIRILDISDTMYHIEAISGMTDSFIVAGWIRHNSPLRLSTMLYYPEDTLTLYCVPSFKSSVVEIIHSDQLPETGLLSVEEILLDDGWVKVSLKGKNHTLTGWTLYNNLCSNPYTTCG